MIPQVISLVNISTAINYPYSVMTCEMLYCICVLIIGNNGFIRQGYWLLKNMYRFHRHEFYIHRKRLILRILFTYSSLILMLVFSIMGFQYSWCMAASYEFHGKKNDNAFHGH